MKDLEPFAPALKIFKINVILLSIMTAIYIAMDQGCL
tara:strand:+ start:190 stop:300 length:111 start_codon:yes stop_codon:yes gene_type:complete